MHASSLHYVLESHDQPAYNEHDREQGLPRCLHWHRRLPYQMAEQHQQLAPPAMVAPLIVETRDNSTKTEHRSRTKTADLLQLLEQEEVRVGSADAMMMAELALPVGEQAEVAAVAAEPPLWRQG
jgi:hypothetical protein